MSLAYPHDRFKGFVQLRDGNGNMYVADRRPSGCVVADAMKFSGAFLVLAKRYNQTKGEK